MKKSNLHVPSLVTGLMLFFILVLSGCVRIDIGDDKHEATLGDQLLDLAVAKKSGLLNETEFSELKQKLLDSF